MSRFRSTSNATSFRLPSYPGQIQATFRNVVASLEYVRTGKLRALGVTTAMRWQTLPEVPTISGFVPGYELSLWNGASL